MLVFVRVCVCVSVYVSQHNQNAQNDEERAQPLNSF